MYKRENGMQSVKPQLRSGLSFCEPFADRGVYLAGGQPNYPKQPWKTTMLIFVSLHVTPSGCNVRRDVLSLHTNTSIVGMRLVMCHATNWPSDVTRFSTNALRHA